MDPFEGTNSKANARLTARSLSQGIAADLIAVLAAVTSGEPRILTIGDRRALPSGPFELAHRSLQSGLRAWVERQTRLPLGYIEQLSWPDARATGIRRARGKLARLVRLFPLGGPSRRAIVTYSGSTTAKTQ